MERYVPPPSPASPSQRADIALHHGLQQRITPHGERPTSVADFERQTGRKALDWAKERARDLGIEDSSSQQTKADDGKSVERGFKD